MGGVKFCPHCRMDIAIRNPSGYCDHLKYPEYCNVCTAIKDTKKLVEKARKEHEKIRGH